MTQKEYKKLYKEIEVIGRGNFGSATLVERVDTKKQFIAKKIVLSSLNPKQQDGALQEAQLLKDLNHKNIVAYVESFKEDDLLIIIMEYCEHGDLAFHIKRKKQKKEHFPEMLIVNWFYELALSIKYIHEKKILHRDIKTSNIFITKDGTIKIGDFGISKVLENTTSVAKTVVGTPYYMSKLLDKNEHDRPQINEVLNDMNTYKLFKQYLEVRVDPTQVKADSVMNHQKKLSNPQQQAAINGNGNDNKGNSTNKENNSVNQLVLINQNDKMSLTKNNFQDTSSPMNTVDSQVYQVNQQQIQTQPNQSDHKEEPEYKVKHRIIKRQLYTPEILNNNNNNNNNNNHNNNFNHNNNQNNNDFNDGTHDEYYHDEDPNAFKSKKDRFDEGAAIKHNNFVKESPSQIQKVKSQQSFNHQSKFKKDDSSKHYDMYSSSGQAHSNHAQVNSQPHNQGLQKHHSHMYQQNQEYFNQHHNPVMEKLTPKQLAQLKKEEKSRLQQEQLTEYTKSQAKNSMISRERYIQNVYGEKFLPNQSSLKQYEDNSHKQQKNQFHLEPISQGNKPLLKNNFLAERNLSPTHAHQQTNFMMIDTQYQQDLPIPTRNASQKSPSHLSQIIKQVDDGKSNQNVYSEIDYPIETTDKFAISTQINNRRRNNGSKNDIMQLLQEEDQQKQFYNQIHRNVPSYKNQFSHISGLPQRTSSYKSYSQQDELAESEVFDQQHLQNKINNLKPKNPKIQQIQQEAISNSGQQQSGVSYSNTQFESEIIAEQHKNSVTLYQDIPLPNVKRIESENLSPSPNQQSFESFFSKEDLSEQEVENIRPVASSKAGAAYKIKKKQNSSSFKGQFKLQKQDTQDDEYGQEQFEEYFSDEDAEFKKQNKQVQNNSQKDLKNGKMGKEQVRKQSNFTNNNNLVRLESIAENDCEQTQFTPIQSMIGHHQNSHSLQQSGRKISSGRPSMNRVDSNHQDSVMKISKKLSHQNSSHSTDDQPPSRLSNQSRNSPRSAQETSSAYKNTSNSQISQEQHKLINLRQKCKQNLGDNFDKVYEIIQKSIQNVQKQRMKSQLVDVVGKDKINVCFEVEQLIYWEEEMKKK